jgi:putative DNA primase/helicase
MTDARRPRRYRPGRPANPELSRGDAQLSPADAEPKPLPWVRGKATAAQIDAALGARPCLDQNGQQIFLNGEPLMSGGSDGKPPFTFEILAAEFQRLHKAAMRANRKAKQREQGEPDVQDAPRDNLPTIELRLADTERIVSEIEDALIASDRGLYRRGGLIVATGFDKMQTWDRRTVEVQIIEERSNYALLEDIEAAADFVRFDARTKKNRKAAPTLTLALTLKQRTNRLRLPNLVSLVNCPTIMANGELMAESGFDDDVGILFDPRGVKFPRVPDRPDKAMAQTALKRIMRLVETFDFVGKDDRAVALSLILTAIARPGLPTAPLHGFDAPVAGSGKSKLVDLASILATGHEAGVTAQGETREEAEKRLSTLLMRGDSIIALDNCEGPLEGVVFNQALTQQWANLRILGQSKAVRTRCASLFAATGNNLVIKGDLTRRAVVCRLDPKVERPELRQYTYDPIADAKDKRGELVAAALTILRAYHVAGRPNLPPRLQSFEQWSDSVRGALIWLGAGDPVATMDRLRKADPVLASLTAVLHAWRGAFGFEPATARRAIEEAERRDDLRDSLMAVAGRGGKIDGRALGNWLAQRVDRVVNLSDDLAPQPVAMAACGTRQGVGLWGLTAK